MFQVNRLQSLVLSVVLVLLALLSATTLLGKPTVGNRLTVISTTDVINELSPCG